MYWFICRFYCWIIVYNVVNFGIIRNRWLWCLDCLFDNGIVCMGVFFLNFILISCERYVVIFFLLNYMWLVIKFCVLSIIGGVWLVWVILICVCFVGILNCIVYLICFVVIGLCYVIMVFVYFFIFWEVRRYYWRIVSE